MSLPGPRPTSRTRANLHLAPRLLLAAAAPANPPRADTRNASAWVMRAITDQQATSTGRGQANTRLRGLQRHLLTSTPATRRTRFLSTSRVAVDPVSALAWPPVAPLRLCRRLSLGRRTRSTPSTRMWTVEVDTGRRRGSGSTAAPQGCSLYVPFSHCTRRQCHDYSRTILVGHTTA